VTTLVTSRLAGADVVMILAIVPTFPAHIVTSKSVTDVKQLKGKVGGVGRPGTTTEIGMRLALARLGIDPNVDVKLIPVGNTADALAALSKGVVQFSILVEPFVREAEKLGYKSLVDIGSINIPFHWNGVLTRQSNVQSKSQLIAKFARAMVEAIHIYKTDRESTLKIISKYTQITDPDSLDRTYQAYIKILPEVPFPAPEGVKTFLDYMAASRPEAAKANPKDFVDLSFVQEVQASGFIRQLYGREKKNGHRRSSHYRRRGDYPQPAKVRQCGRSRWKDYRRAECRCKSPQSAENHRCNRSLCSSRCSGSAYSYRRRNESCR